MQRRGTLGAKSWSSWGKNSTTPNYGKPCPDLVANQANTWASAGKGKEGTCPHLENRKLEQIKEKIKKKGGKVNINIS